MQVTITEKYIRGIYFTNSSTIIDGKNVILGAFMYSGSMFAERLAHLEDGFFRSFIVDVPNVFSKKGAIKLSCPAGIPSNQKEKVA